MYGDGDESPSVEAPLQRTGGQINPCVASSRRRMTAFWNDLLRHVEPKRGHVRADHPAQGRRELRDGRPPTSPTPTDSPRVSGGRSPALLAASAPDRRSVRLAMRGGVDLWGGPLTFASCRKAFRMIDVRSNLFSFGRGEWACVSSSTSTAM
jgi:hypothetical protein